MDTVVTQTLSIFRMSGLVALALSLSGCDIININDRFLNQADRRITGYQIVTPAMAWASVPGQTTVMQRFIGNEVEQIIALPNATSIQGDNRMIMRASRRGMEGAGRLRVEALRTRIGGFPEPFAALKTSDMISADDDLGSFSYATTVYGQTTCVLAVRKVNPEQRPIPARRNAVDAVLRNCVIGSAEDALMPIRAASFGYAGFAGPDSASGTRLLSPLSAPLPE